MNTATFPCRVSQSRAVTELGHGTTLLGVAQIKILLEAEGAPMLQLVPVLEGEKKKKSNETICILTVFGTRENCQLCHV